MTDTTKKPHGLFRVIEALQSDSMRLDPYPYFQEMRQHSPLRFDSERHCWDVFTYQDVHFIYQNPKLFSSLHPPDREGLPGLSVLTQDPPTHTRLRSLFAKAFTPSAISRLAPEIAAITAELIDSLIATGTGRGDLAEAIAFPLPISVLAALIGVPPEDRANFKQWSAIIFAELKEDDSGENIALTLAEKEKTQQLLAGYFFSLFANKRELPTHDLISTLVHAEVDGEKLTEHELLEFCILLLIAGFETTAGLITNAVRCFLDQPDAQERLMQQPELIPAAIEEVLRFRSPMLTNTRYATEDVVLSGQTIKKGDQLILWMASANRDEQAFERADQFVLDRSPNQHLAFGSGVHFCMGSSLARLEAQIAVPKILTRLKNLRYADQTLLRPVQNPIACGVSEFPVQFDL